MEKERKLCKIAQPIQSGSFNAHNEVLRIMPEGKVLGEKKEEDDKNTEHYLAKQDLQEAVCQINGESKKQKINWRPFATAFT